MSFFRPSLTQVAHRYGSLRADRWAPVPPEIDALVARDAELHSVARAAREALARTVATRLGELDPRYLAALLAVPRERFVLPEDIGLSAFDAPLPLDAEGRATVSAPHAYLLTFRLLGLGEGDHLLELGTGTGYGASLAREIVGPRGHVTTIEIDPELSARACRLIGAPPLHAGRSHAPGITILCGDARLLAPRWMMAEEPGPLRPCPNKIAVTYALTAMPPEIEAALVHGTTLVAPVGETEDDQELCRYQRSGDELRVTAHGAVRYVMERKS